MADDKKYLNYAGLRHYHSLLKKYIGDKISELAQAPVSSNDGSIVINGSDLAVHVDGVTIIKDSTNKYLKVNPTSLPSYSGVNAIKISDASTTSTSGAKNKKVELVIDSSDKFLTQSNNGLKANLTLAKFEGQAAASLGNNVKEAYGLTDKSGNLVGEYIKIYKDSSLLSVKLLHSINDLKPTYDEVTDTWTDIPQDLDVADPIGTIDPEYNELVGTTPPRDIHNTHTTEYESLCFAYQTTNGTVSVECIPVGKFLQNSEFADGLVVSDAGIVKVDISNQSEKLTTSSGNVDALKIITTGTAAQKGLCIQGIASHVDYKIGLLDSIIYATSANNAKAFNTSTGADTNWGTDQFISIKLEEVDGKLNSAQIRTNNIAKASELSDEITRAKATEGDLASAIGGTYNVTTHAGNIYSPGANTIATGTTIQAAIQQLDTALAAAILTPITYGSIDGQIDSSKEVDILFGQFTLNFTLPKELSAFTAQDKITIVDINPTSIVGTIASGSATYDLHVRGGSMYVLYYESNGNQIDLYNLQKSGNELSFYSPIATGSTLSFRITDLHV